MAGYCTLVLSLYFRLQLVKIRLHTHAISSHTAFLVKYICIFTTCNLYFFPLVKESVRVLVLS